MNIYEKIDDIVNHIVNLNQEIQHKDKVINDLRAQLELSKEVHNHYHYDKPCTLPHTNGYNIGGIPINWSVQAQQPMIQQANQQNAQCDAIGK